MDNFYIDTSVLHGLKVLSNIKKEEAYEIFLQRYPIAENLMNPTNKERVEESLDRLLSISHEEEFSDVFDLTYEFLMDVESKDKQWFNSVDLQSIILLGKKNQIEQEKFHDKLKDIPNGKALRKEVIAKIADAYRQLCEGLVRQTYAVLLSFGSVYRNRKMEVSETIEMKSFTVYEQLKSLRNGKYTPLLKYYSNTLRNACAHNGIEFESYEENITFSDNTKHEVMTGDEFCKNLYCLKQMVDNILLAIEMYRMTKTENDAKELLMRVSKQKLLDLLFEEMRIRLFLDSPDTPFASIKLGSIEIRDNKVVKIKIMGYSPENDERAKWVSSLSKYCVDIIINSLISLNYPIYSVEVTACSGDKEIGKVRIRLKENVVKKFEYIPAP